MICILIAEHLQLFALLAVLYSTIPKIVLHASESDGVFLMRACLDSIDCQHLSHLKSGTLTWSQDLGISETLAFSCINALPAWRGASAIPRSQTTMLAHRWSKCSKAASIGVPLSLIPLDKFPAYVSTTINALVGRFRAVQQTFKDSGVNEM